MKVSGSGKAQAGVLVRNDASEPGSQSEAIYADLVKSDQIWQAWRKEWSKSFRKC